MSIKSACEANGIKITDRRNTSMGGGDKRAKSKVTHIARHHSGVNVDQSMAILEGYWKNTHGWNTGGYHVVIHPDGSVDWNYDYDVTSNGVGNHNSYIFNISVLGNGKFTAAQEKSWQVVCTEAQRELGIPTSKVLGHNEFKGHESNACPGIDMSKVRESLTVKKASEGVVKTVVAKSSASNPDKEGRSTKFKRGDKVKLSPSAKKWKGSSSFGLDSFKSTYEVDWNNVDGTIYISPIGADWGGNVLETDIEHARNNDIQKDDIITLRKQATHWFGGSKLTDGMKKADYSVRERINGNTLYIDNGTFKGIVYDWDAVKK